jgi:hypothetical protein
MFTYERFAETYDWSPRIVDELTDDELFWLPVIRDAKTEAARQVSEAKK